MNKEELKFLIFIKERQIKNLKAELRNAELTLKELQKIKKEKLRKELKEILDTMINNTKLRIKTLRKIIKIEKAKLERLRA